MSSTETWRTLFLKICGILSGIKDKRGLTVCRDRGVAIDLAMKRSVKDDLVMVLGKVDEASIDYGIGKLYQRDADVLRHGVQR